VGACSIPSSKAPIIVKETNSLYVTDIPYGRIFAIDLITKNWSLVIEYDGEPNGLAWHPQRKEIIIADFKSGILALNPITKAITPVITRFNGEHFKGPNDIIVDANGAIIFTDQGMTGLQDPTGRVYRLHANGRMDVLLRNCPSPNGLVLNKDETVLFVAMTRDNSIWHVPLHPDSSAQRTGRFSSYYGLGGPDGMAMDVEGNILVAHSTLGTVFVHRSSGEPFSCNEVTGKANSEQLKE
jgi:gluconolactonase